MVGAKDQRNILGAIDLRSIVVAHVIGCIALGPAEIIGESLL